MKHLLDKIETRQQLIRETAGRLCEQITELSAQLAAAERALERLEITRETMLELAAEDNAEPPGPLPPGYPEILTAFETAREGLRAKDLCEALGTGTEPRHVETMQAKLKRLVDRDILTEPEPGLFTRPGPVNQPSPATSSN